MRPLWLYSGRMKVLTIRLDDDLHARIKEVADRDARSLNGQITWLLKAGLDASRPAVSLHVEYESGSQASDVMARNEEQLEAAEKTLRHLGYSKGRQAGRER